MLAADGKSPEWHVSEEKMALAHKVLRYPLCSEAKSVDHKPPWCYHGRPPGMLQATKHQTLSLISKQVARTFLWSFRKLFLSSKCMRSVPIPWFPGKSAFINSLFHNLNLFPLHGFILHKRRQYCAWENNYTESSKIQPDLFFSLLCGLGRQDGTGEGRSIQSPIGLLTLHMIPSRFPNLNARRGTNTQINK